MRSFVHRLSAVAVVAIGAAVPLAAQNVPVRTLAKPEAEFPEPFTQVSGVRELRDGRVVVIDPRDKIVQVIDFRTGTAVKVGREGSGPGEYAMPMSLLALPGDTSAVFDPLNRRFLLVTPEGKAGPFLEMGAGGGGPGGMVMSIGRPAGADARGRIYSQGSPFRLTGDGPPQAIDSAAIERWDRVTKKRDTVAYLPLPKGSTQVSGGRGGNVQVRVGGGNPFAPQDQFAVAPDGRVAILHAADYSITWIGPSGQRTKSGPIRHERLRVTEAHKQEWRDQMRGAMAMMVTNENGRQSARMAPMRDVRDPPEWPEYLPPFLAGAASFAQDGTLWVRRTTPAGQPPTFDLINGAGQVVQRVVLPKRSRLVGFGKGTVYLVRTDDDDLQYLQRYRFSAPERP